MVGGKGGALTRKYKQSKNNTCNGSRSNKNSSHPQDPAEVFSELNAASTAVFAEYLSGFPRTSTNMEAWIADKVDHEIERRMRDEVKGPKIKCEACTDDHDERVCRPHITLGFLNMVQLFHKQEIANEQAEYNNLKQQIYDDMSDVSSGNWSDDVIARRRAN